MSASKLPVGDDGLDDRLAFVGTSGSGKTYGAGVLVERLLAKGARVVILDPLGVWWGLRLAPDGVKPSRFKLPIFGGKRGDLPITEGSGALIGETVATMAESALIDLKGIESDAAKRRFALAFFRAFRAKTTGELVHLIIDEADLWAPQVILDKEGDSQKLLDVMNSVVRRGRVDGFIPWLICQRPAVLNKNVLSQADGLVAFKLTSSQDREALGGWIDGQADRAEGKRILADLPTLPKGDAYVWLPGRAELAREHFPLKETFDSSQTPKRGQTLADRVLKPLDVEALRAQLSKVEGEIKAKDPVALQAKVAELERQLKAERSKKPGAAIAPAPAKPTRQEESARAAHFEKLLRDALRKGVDEALDQVIEAIAKVRARAAAAKPGKWQTVHTPYNLEIVRALKSSETTEVIIPKTVQLKVNGVVHEVKPQVSGMAAPLRERFSPAQISILEAISFWDSLGFKQPTRSQVAVAARRSPSSSGFDNLLGSLRSAGAIEYPAPSKVAAAGDWLPFLVPVPATARERLRAILSPAQNAVVDALAPGEELTLEQLATKTGRSATSSGFDNLRGSLRSLGVIRYPKPGLVTIEDWVWL